MRHHHIYYSIYFCRHFASTLKDMLGLASAIFLIREVLEHGKMLYLAFYYYKSFRTTFHLKAAKQLTILYMSYKKLDSQHLLALSYSSEAVGPGFKDIKSYAPSSGLRSTQLFCF